MPLRVRLTDGLGRTMPLSTPYGQVDLAKHRSDCGLSAGELEVLELAFPQRDVQEIYVAAPVWPDPDRGKALLYVDLYREAAFSDNAHFDAIAHGWAQLLTDPCVQFLNCDGAHAA